MKLLLGIVALVSIASADERGRVIGVGGIFLKSHNHERLRSWYEGHLGLKTIPGQGITLRSDEKPNKQYWTIWSVFPSASQYFAPSNASFMINYIVDDLDALLAKLLKAGVKIDSKREDHDYGRFAWVYDPDGNKVELWEPKTSEK